MESTTSGNDNHPERHSASDDDDDDDELDEDLAERLRNLNPSAPLIRLHGSGANAPGGASPAISRQRNRRQSDFCGPGMAGRPVIGEIHLAPPRPTVTTPPPGRKRSASLPGIHHLHGRSPSPIPASIQGSGGSTQGRSPSPRTPDIQLQDLSETRERLSRKKGRKGRPSLDLSAARGHQPLVLGSHMDSEIARRRHSIAVHSSGGGGVFVKGDDAGGSRSSSSSPSSCEAARFPLDARPPLALNSSSPENSPTIYVEPPVTQQN